MLDFWNHIPYSNLFSGLFALITALAVSFYATPVIVRIARDKNLLNVPNERTSHNGAVPMLGGVSIFAGLVIGASLFIPEGGADTLRFVLCAVIILFFIGQKDDISGISWKKKLLAQIISACILVFLADIRLTTLHGFLGIHEIPYWISAIISLFVFILIINAFNLIDGIDGLASAIGILTSFIFGIWLYGVDQYPLAVVAWSLTGGLIPFFFYNVFGKKNKIFMGDTGSLLIGILSATFAVALCKDELPTDHFLYMQATPAVVIAVLIYPLFDVLRIIFIRLKQRKSLFSPDRGHIHHLFLASGISHRRSTFYIILFNLVAIAWAFLMRQQPILFVVLTLLLGCVAGVLILRRRARKRMAIKA